MTDRRVLDNWKEIGAYLGRTGKTCRNWEKEYGLPVHRLDGSPSAHVFAYTDELERWKAEMLREEQKHKGIVHGLEWEKELLGQNKAGRLILRLLPRLFRKPAFAIPAAVLLAATVAAAVWFFDRQSKIRWARNTALPELERMVEAAKPLIPNNSFEVLNLFEKGSKYLPHDPKIKELRPWCVAEVNVETEPSQARVFIKEFSRPESEWRPVGLSPIDKGRFPNGYLRWRIEKEGYDPIEFVGASSPHYDDMNDVYTPRTIKRVLDKTGIVPPGMARIGGYDFGKEVRFEGYLIDKYEVSNFDYKDFVDSGGYGRREFWKHPFVKEGKPLSWEKAMALFRDSTGRPGPASWVGGTYPDGQADYPVAGVSWYEAAAFAEFKKKSLPLVPHWVLAQGMDAGHRPPLVLELPFLNIEGSGPWPVGSKQGLKQNGVYDLRGNVWEWLVNDCRDGKCIAGGAWNDPTYQTRISYLPSFERSPRVGFRCVIGPDPRKIPDFALRPYTPPPPKRDFYKEKPVSDAVFEIYREQFSYDKTDLQAKVEKRDDSPPDWIEEKVSFAAAYGGERVLGRLFLPKKTSPPFSCLIVFPGSGVVSYPSSESLGNGSDSLWVAHLIAGGRAVLLPVYKGTFERSDPKIYGPIHTGNETRASMEYWIQLVKDFRRSVDYLETRPDIAADKIAYYGASWGGGGIAPVILAVETRIKASVILMAGLPYEKKLRPEVDPINYITRVKTPTLIFSGKYDLLFPYELSAKPFFELLGTPREHKFQKVYPGEHFVAKVDFVRDSLEFLDKYLGPAKK